MRPRKITKIFSSALLFVAGICLLGVSASIYAEEIAYEPLPRFGIPVGGFFPLDNLIDMRGSRFEKNAFLGKRLLINFYTVNCAPCIKEVPKLNKIRTKRNDVNFLAITADSAATSASYVKQYGLNWPIAAGAQALLFDKLNVQAFPAFALLDANGRLLSTVQANQLGGEDGHATVAGIEKWVDFQSSKR